MSVSHVLAAPPADIDLVRYLVWYVQFSRVALEIMADATGIELDAPPHYAAVGARFTEGFGALDAALLDLSPPDPQQQFRLDVARRVSAFLRRVAEIGPLIEADDRAEAAALLGTLPATTAECDAALEAFVAHADPSMDEALIRFFHRRMSRWQLLVEAGMHGRRYSAQPLGAMREARR
jgi:hypothetical protein